MNSSKPASALSSALKLFTHRFSGEAKVNLISNGKPRVQVAVAVTEKERREAFHLGYVEYIKKGFVEENQSELLVHEADLKPGTIVLNAYVENELAGTVTIVSNKGSELPFVSTFKNRSPEFLLNGSYSEIIRLAISENYRSNNDVLLSLFNYAYICSKFIRKTSGFVIEVNPRHKKFYERMIGFASLEVSSPCGRVNDAPAELLWIDFKGEKEYREKHSFLLSVTKQKEITLECLLRIRGAPINNAFDKLLEDIFFESQAILV